MFLNIDKQKKKSVALIDDRENRLTYGELTDKIGQVKVQVEPRSLIFILCKNTVGSVTGYLAFVEQNAVPVTLSSEIDEKLLADLINIYLPAYLWVPDEEKHRFNYEEIFMLYGYSLLKTGNTVYPVNEQVQLCMTTSGSTGSPKLVRYKKENLEHNAKNVAAAFEWDENERAICDLGMQYTMGLNVINTHLYVGATVLLTTYNLMSGEFWDFTNRMEGVS